MLSSTFIVIYYFICQHFLFVMLCSKKSEFVKYFRFAVKMQLTYSYFIKARGLFIFDMMMANSHDDIHRKFFIKQNKRQKENCKNIISKKKAKLANSLVWKISFSTYENNQQTTLIAVIETYLINRHYCMAFRLYSNDKVFMGHGNPW